MGKVVIPRPDDSKVPIGPDTKKIPRRKFLHGEGTTFSFQSSRLKASLLKHHRPLSTNTCDLQARWSSGMTRAMEEKGTSDLVE